MHATSSAAARDAGIADPRVETWVLTDSPRPMVAQLRDWARLARTLDRRVVLVEMARSDVVSWPVLALTGRLASILQAQQSALGLVVNAQMRERSERAGIGVPVFSELDEALAWASTWLEEQTGPS